MDELAHRVLDDLALGLWVARIPSAETIYSNPAFVAMLGRPAATATDLSELARAHGLFDREGRPYPTERGPFDQALRAGGRVVVDDMVVHRSDGQRVYLRVCAHPIMNEGADGGGVMVVTMTDITAEVQAQREHKSVQERLAFAVSHAPIILWMLDREGIVTLSEGAGLRGLGVAPGQLVGQSVFDMYRDEPQILANVHKALAGESISHVYDAGDALCLQSHLAPMFGSQGDVTGLIGVATDVTETRRLEERLFHAQKMEAVGRLAGGIAHDFNNLLSAIQGFALTSHERQQEGGPTRDDLEQILRACERGALLTRQLLAFSRREAFRPEVVDVNAAVLDFEKIARRLIGPEVEIRIVLGPDAARVNVGAGQLEQLLMNLVVNARDAMSASGGGVLTVEVNRAILDDEYRRRHPDVVVGPYVMIAVSDTGVGMDQQTQDRMFEPFFTTKDKGRGTGLGLASVYAIVSQGQGHIAVTSEPGRGSTFRVYLPLCEASPIPARPVEPAAVPLPASLSGTETVLVVEDHEMLRQLSCQVLRQSGYAVLEAPGPSDALAICQEHAGEIDLLLTDVVMPRMNGFALAAQIKRLRPSTRVLFMSGHASAERPRTAGELFIEKPFAPQALLAQVRRLLERQTQ